MSSDRKAVVNRDNAKRSTGPKTAAGKSRSRRNAFRHGLAIAINSQAHFSEEVAAIAESLAEGSSPMTQFVRELAESEIDLQRIRRVRASQFAPMIGNSKAPLEAYAELAKNLKKLERYERRAYSRRKRALAAFILLEE